MNTKQKLLNKHLTALVLASLLLGGFMFAAKTQAQTVTRGYAADTVLQRGIIVKLKDNDPTRVEPVNSSQAEKVHGVVINPGDAAVVLGHENEKVFVASSGPYTVLVSDQAGNIKQGSYIAVSGVSGIGMATNTTDKIVIGKAIDGFDASDPTQVKSTAVIKDASGKEKTLKLGAVRVDLSIAVNPTQKAASNLPITIKAATKTVANQPANPTRVYLAFFVFLATAVIAGGMLYSAVKSTMVAIGRNPLGRKAIYRGLTRVVFVSIIIFITGLFAVYLLLMV